jgi:hypothetical protein
MPRFFSHGRNGMPKYRIRAREVCKGILCILFAVFLSLFALDVFDEHLGFWKTLLALAVI